MPSSTAMFTGAGLSAAAMGGQMMENGKAANASQNIAVAQQQRADQAMAFAQPTSQQLQQMTSQNMLSTQAISFQQSQLANITSQLSSLNPTIKAAFDQQGQILKGQVPDYLSPLQKQLQMQAQASTSAINATMGRGADSSSAGLAAKSRFGQDNAMTMMNAEQQGLNTLGNVGANAVNTQNSLYSAFGAMGQSASALNQGAFNMSNQVQTNQVNAALGTAKYQGANNTAALYNAQGAANMFGTIAGASGGSALSSAFGPQSPSNAGAASGMGFASPSYASSGLAGVGGTGANSAFSLFGAGNSADLAAAAAI
jgi:CTP-dependent riboflavin kinase